MKVLFDDFGYVIDYAIIGDIEGAVEVPDLDFDKISLEQLYDEHKSYHLVDGKLTKDETKLDEIRHHRKLNGLRADREVECFEVINRSNLWYNTLTDEQKVELDTWYHAWLDVTDTLVVPERPKWLK